MNHTASYQIRNEGIKEIPFKISRIEDNRNEENAASSGDSYKIIWVKQGSGTHLIDMNKYEIAGNTIHCIAPRRLHFFDSADAEGYILTFTPGFLHFYETSSHLFSNGSFHDFLNSPVIKISGQFNSEMNEITEKMNKEFEYSYSASGQILRELLKIFLIYINRQTTQTEQQLNQTGNAELAGRFLTLLEKNYTTRKMVSHYAMDLSVTPNYLNEIVKKVSGFPASYHIQQRIVLEAKRKAAYVKMSMKEVAYHLGFDDISHFSKFFKNVSGVNFTDFKKEITQQLSFG